MFKESLIMLKKCTYNSHYIAHYAQVWIDYNVNYIPSIYLPFLRLLGNYDVTYVVIALKFRAFTEHFETWKFTESYINLT